MPQKRLYETVTHLFPNHEIIIKTQEIRTLTSVSDTFRINTPNLYIIYHIAILYDNYIVKKVNKSYAPFLRNDFNMHIVKSLSYHANNKNFKYDKNITRKEYESKYLNPKYLLNLINEIYKKKKGKNHPKKLPIKKILFFREYDSTRIYGQKLIEFSIINLLRDIKYFGIKVNICE